MNVSRAFEIIIKTPLRAVRKELSIERGAWQRKTQLRKSKTDHKKGCGIFLWIPKTAGTSLWHELYFDEEQFLITIEDIKTVRPDSGITTFGHFSIPQLLDAELLNQKYFKSAWKFTIVRNPYDRTVSIFEYLKLTKELPPTTSFSIFCQYLQENAFEPIGLYNYHHLSQLNPQVSWLKNSKGQIFADFIGRYENLEDDANLIFEKLGIKSSSLPHKNPTKRKPIKSYYSTKEVDIIQAVYNEDFETFNYSLQPDF